MDTRHPPQYHHVAPVKFFLMNLSTLGLYQLYWMYKGWQFIKERDERDIQPFWRAFFTLFWFPAFCRDVFRQYGRSEGWWVGLSLTYVVLYFVSNFELTIVLVYLLLNTLNMLPIVVVIDRLNKGWHTEGPRYNRYTARHAVSICMGMGLLGLLTISETERQQVMDGMGMTNQQMICLQEHGLIDANDHIHYISFTSQLASVESGHFFTDEGLTIYNHSGDSLQVDAVRFEDIVDVYVCHESSSLLKTAIRIDDAAGDSWVIILPDTEDESASYITAFIERWQSVNSVEQEQTQKVYKL